MGVGRLYGRVLRLGTGMGVGVGVGVKDGSCVVVGCRSGVVVVGVGKVVVGSGVVVFVVLVVASVVKLLALAALGASGSSTPCPWYSEVVRRAPWIWVMWVWRCTAGNA